MTSDETSRDFFAEHRDQVAQVLPTGDASAIKRLYVDMGSQIERQLDGAIDDAPVLSLPETAPVVSRLLDDVVGVLLDAGCGPNPALAVELGRRPGRVIVGLDIGTATVRLAREVASRRGVELLAVVGDVEALPFRSGAFDGGVCDDTIEHLPDDGAGAAELARVVRRGGRMVIATPNRHSVEVVVRKARDRLHGVRNPPSEYFAATSHLREYTWPDFERLVAGTWRIRDRAGVGWAGSGRRRVATAVTSVPPFRRFSRMVVVAAEPR